jgi:hypothetical protein
MKEGKRRNVGSYLLKLAVVMFVLFYVLRLVLFYIIYPVSHVAYSILSLALFAAIFCALPFFAYRKIMQTPDVTSAKSISVPVSKELVCELVPQAILKNSWKLMDADKALGHFKARIGMSIWTWGETMLVDVSKSDDGSTKVDVYCEVIHHQKADYGKLDKDIERFFSELEKLTKQTSG